MTPHKSFTRTRKPKSEPNPGKPEPVKEEPVIAPIDQKVMIRIAVPCKTLPTGQILEPGSVVSVPLSVAASLERQGFARIIRQIGAV